MNAVIIALPTAARFPPENPPKRPGRLPKMVISNRRLECARRIRNEARGEPSADPAATEMLLAMAIIRESPLKHWFSPSALSELEVLFRTQWLARKKKEDEA